jgi:hypothetical protein
VVNRKYFFGASLLSFLSSYISLSPPPPPPRLVHPSDMFTDNSLVKDDFPQNVQETLKYVFIDSSFHLNLIIFLV